MERWVQPRDLRESVDLPVQEPMRAGRNNKTPSTDQKRQLRRKTATEISADAWRLNPGDKVRGPNGQLLTIKDVKPHKTDQSKCVITLDGGGAMVEDRGANFTIVRGNGRQMSLPENPGLPGGNFNYLPGGAAVEGIDPGSVGGSQTCPNCHGSMRQQQGVLTCTQCGFQTFPGGASGAPGGNFGMDGGTVNQLPLGGGSQRKLINGSKTAAERPLRTFAAKYAPPTTSAIARRAQAVLDSPEGAL